MSLKLGSKCLKFFFISNKTRYMVFKCLCPSFRRLICQEVIKEEGSVVIAEELFRSGGSTCL